MHQHDEKTGGSGPKWDGDIVKALLRIIGENPGREGLIDTPRRAIAAWKFWTKGYREDPATVLKTFEDGAENYDEMVFQGAIPFFSTCEHHLAPFFGVAHIGYIPDGRVVGLSKLARLLDIFARRLTMQERVTSCVADSLMTHLKPKGVGVVLQARHCCMESRGVCKIGTITMTSALRGGLRNSESARHEFMTLVSTASAGLRAL